MKDKSQLEAASRLNGFLYGLSAFSGNMRQYEGSAYLLERGDQNQSAAELINEYFEGQYEFQFDPPEILKGGKGELERCIGAFAIRDSKCVKEDYISDLQNYLSFRAMDMIEDIFWDDYASLKVIKLQLKSDSPSRDCVFFCVLSSSLLLVIQFNEYGELQARS
jgi:hypothetical protein